MSTKYHSVINSLDFLFINNYALCILQPLLCQLKLLRVNILYYYIVGKSVYNQSIFVFIALSCVLNSVHVA